MSAIFKLNYSGLNYVLASTEDCKFRRFLVELLKNNCYRSVTVDELETMLEADKKQLVQTLYALLRKGWLNTIDKENVQACDDANNELFNDALSSQLAALSSTGSVMLVDLNGFVIFNTGFADIDADTYAAYVTGLILTNEQAKNNLPGLDHSVPWGVNVSWGGFNSHILQLCMGKQKFILVIGGEQKLEQNAYFELIAILARRYHHE